MSRTWSHTNARLPNISKHICTLSSPLVQSKQASKRQGHFPNAPSPALPLLLLALPVGEELNDDISTQPELPSRGKESGESSKCQSTACVWNKMIQTQARPHDPGPTISSKALKPGLATQLSTQLCHTLFLCFKAEAQLLGRESFSSVVQPLLSCPCSGKPHPHTHTHNQTLASKPG